VRCRAQRDDHPAGHVVGEELDQFSCLRFQVVCARKVC
jgi:hypothetical protein